MRWLLRLVAFIAAFVFLGVIVLLLAGGASGKGRHAAAVELAAPAPAVFAHLVQPELLPKWVGGLQKSEPVTGGAPSVGSKSKELIGEGDDTYEVEATITQLQQDKLLGLEIRHAAFRTRGTWVVKARGEDRAVLIHEATTEYHHPVARLLSPVLVRLNQQKLEEDLLRLKALVEHPVAPAVSAAAAATGSDLPSAPATDANEAPPEDPTITSSDDAETADERAIPSSDGTTAVRQPEAPVVTPLNGAPSSAQAPSTAASDGGAPVQDAAATAPAQTSPSSVPAAAPSAPPAEETSEDERALATTPEKTEPGAADPPPQPSPTGDDTADATGADAPATAPSSGAPATDEPL